MKIWIWKKRYIKANESANAPPPTNNEHLCYWDRTYTDIDLVYSL